MVMDEGRIVEQGTHAELLTLGAHYAKLHAMQFRETEVVAS
jgi:subfamily B ATP-binding cassette protein MsbA